MSQNPQDMDPEQFVHYGVIRALNEGNLDAIREDNAEDMTYVSAEGETGTREDMVADIEEFLEAFPDAEADVEEVLVDGEDVFFEFVVRGTQEGQLEDLPPTGETMTARGMSFLRIEDGAIREHNIVYDRFGMLRQLGAL